MPRFLQLVALALVFAISGAPAWIAELAGDDCAEKCSDEPRCPDEGCADCSVICSTCARTHALPVTRVASALFAFDVSEITFDASESVPPSPPPEDVFHQDAELRLALARARSAWQSAYTVVFDSDVIKLKAVALALPAQPVLSHRLRDLHALKCALTGGHGVQRVHDQGDVGLGRLAVSR